LQKKQSEISHAYQKKHQRWRKQDPATRGVPPQMGTQFAITTSKRYRQLNDKVKAAQNFQATRVNLRTLSEIHNIPFSDSEIEAVVELEREKQIIMSDYRNAMMEFSKNRRDSGALTNLADRPQMDQTRLSELDRRIKAIKGKLDAAVTAARARTELTRLSKQYNVPILVNEIDELMALMAEKESLEMRFNTDFLTPWLNAGGLNSGPQPLMNNTDYERIKAIDARIKAIRSPIMTAKQVEREAQNPQLKAYRLQKERQEREQQDWKDLQQAGEVAPGATQTSPSYNQIKEYLTDYRGKLQARADEMGFQVSEADFERLEALNAKILDLRKSVYEMEKTGKTMVANADGSASQSFALMAEMMKMSLIVQKQQQILTPLVEGRNQAGVAGAYARYASGGNMLLEAQLMPARQTPSIQQMVDQWTTTARSQGREISQSEIDDLFAFERSLESK